MGLERKKGVELFFPKNWNKNHSSSSCVFYVVPLFLIHQLTLVVLQFVHLMTQKSLHFINEWKKCWKVFNSRYMFNNGQFYPIQTNEMSSKKFQWFAWKKINFFNVENNRKSLVQKSRHNTHMWLVNHEKSI